MLWLIAITFISIGLGLMKQWCPGIKAQLHIRHQIYRQIPIISRIKSKNSNVFHVVLQLSFSNPLKPVVKMEM